MPGERTRCSKSERLVTRERISSCYRVLLDVFGLRGKNKGMAGQTNLVEDFLFLKLAELGSCPFEVEACLFCDATHDFELTVIDRWIVDVAVVIVAVCCRGC